MKGLPGNFPNILFHKINGLIADLSDHPLHSCNHSWIAFATMNILFLFGIFSGLFARLTSGDPIIQKTEKISCKQDNYSKEKPSFVIHQYIGHDTYTEAIRGLDEKLKKLIVLLQDKVGIPDDRKQGKTLNLSVTFLSAIRGLSEGWMKSWRNSSSCYRTRSAFLTIESRVWH